MLRKLAAQNQINITGSERAGSFSCRGVTGDYEFGEAGLRGKLSGHGVKGEFSFVGGEVVVTITDKPFWLPEMLLKQKLTAGLDTFCNELVGLQLRAESFPARDAGIGGAQTRD